MKTRQPQLRAIPQFDSGRWKLRLEFVPVHPDNETTMGVGFESATQARVNETNEAHCFLLPIERGRRTINILSNESGPPAISETAAASRSRQPQRQ
jgi:hypothetical protein